MNRVGEFEKVSFEQFRIAMDDAFHDIGYTTLPKIDNTETKIQLIIMTAKTILLGFPFSKAFLVLVIRIVNIALNIKNKNIIVPIFGGIIFNLNNPINNSIPLSTHPIVKINDIFISFCIFHLSGLYEILVLSVPKTIVTKSFKIATKTIAFKFIGIKLAIQYPKVNKIAN